MSASTNKTTNYEQQRLGYINARDTLRSSHNDISAVENQMIDTFINDAKVFASTLVTYELVVKNRVIQFDKIQRE